jgi:hypothetical protein
MLEALFREHRLIESCACSLEALLEAEAPLSVTELAQRRLTFGRVCIAHISAESRCLYSRVEAETAPELLRQGRACHRALLELFRDLVTHHRVWPLHAIETDWAGYREELKALLARLRQQIAIEEALFHSLFLDSPEATDSRRLARPQQAPATASG